jgi:hypothetical protein
MRSLSPLPILILSALSSLASPCGSAAQQRPLTTEDPEVIGAGRVLVEAGVETGQNAQYPLSGLSGDRVALPLGVSFGLGSVAELQIDSGYAWLGIDSRADAPLANRVRPDISHTSDILDITIATKIRFVSESARRPSFAVRFATRLPNASNESGLGLDTTDFYFSVLAGKTVGSVRIVGNAGVGILSNPLVGTIQDDAFVGGVSVARALSKGLEIVGEIGGQAVWFAQTPPIGAEPLGEVRAALRYTRGRTRVDGGILAGFTKRSPDFGVMAGVTIVGQAFKAP